MAVQDSPTSISVSWSPSGIANGYRIDYNSSGGDQGSETVSGDSTYNHTLTGLRNGEVYTLSVLATSEHFTSESATTPHNIGLGNNIASNIFVIALA